MPYYCKQYICACIVINYYHCKYKKLFIVIYPTCFGTKEPEDEWLCKAVLILINTYAQNLDIVERQLSSTSTTASCNMWGHAGSQKLIGG